MRREKSYRISPFSLSINPLSRRFRRERLCERKQSGLSFAYKSVVFHAFAERMKYFETGENTFSTVSREKSYWISPSLVLAESGLGFVFGQAQEKSGVRTMGVCRKCGGSGVVASGSFLRPCRSYSALRLRST